MTQLWESIERGDVRATWEWKDIMSLHAGQRMKMIEHDRRRLWRALYPFAFFREEQACISGASKQHGRSERGWIWLCL